MQSHQPAPYVICIDNHEYRASLQLRKVYRTVPDPAAEAQGCLRVIDEDDHPYLFPANRFLPFELTDVLREALELTERSSAATP